MIAVFPITHSLLNDNCVICNVTVEGVPNEVCRRCLSVFKKILLYRFNQEIFYLKSAGRLKGEMWIDLECFTSSRATERACLSDADK